MSIKQKLIALFLVIGLVPTLAVGIAAYVALSRQLEKNTSEQLSGIAVKQEQKINAQLQAKQEEVSKLANQFDFQVALGTYLSSNHTQGTSEIRDILQKKKIEVPDIQSISVANLSGKTTVSTVSDAEGKQLPSGTFSFGPDEDMAIAVREDERDGLNKLYITATLSVNKKESALMSVVYRIDDITATVQDYAGLGSTGETIVAGRDAKGNAISLFPLRFDTDAALKTNLNSMDLFDASDKIKTQVTDYRRHEVIVAARSAGFANWVIATKMDKDEALASIVELQNALIGITLISSMVISGIALWFGRFFTNPILAIAQTAEKIGRGDFTARTSVEYRDEIGTLARSVNSMGSSLNRFVSDIESQRNRLEVILNSTVESIMAVDKEGVIIIANKAAAELAGQNIDELIGKRISSVFQWMKEMSAFTIDYTTPGVTTYPDLEYLTPTSSQHYVKVIVARVSGEKEQKAAQTIVTIHDETKNRELEDMKVDFVSMAAHELRTPLASLRGYLELISYKEKQPDPEVKAYIQQALGSATELGGLINNLLDVTKIERGALSLNMEKMDIAKSVKKTVQDMLYNASQRQQKLNYEGPSEGEFVFGDVIALREVMNNLVSNAVKYTQSGGRIDVSMHREGDEYVVKVKDNGIGIPQAALANLFTKFYRVHGGLDSGNNGTGLGLYISKSIIERHGGTIGVQSEETVGSTFTVRLPVFNEMHQFMSDMQQKEPNMTRIHRGWTTKNIAR